MFLPLHSWGASLPGHAGNYWVTVDFRYVLTNAGILRYTTYCYLKLFRKWRPGSSIYSVEGGGENRLFGTICCGFLIGDVFWISGNRLPIKSSKKDYKICQNSVKFCHKFFFVKNIITKLLQPY